MQFIDKRYLYILLSIPAISFVLHFHVFGLDLMGIHVWRQAETQTVINNFYTGDCNILHPAINGKADTNQWHRMEFPLMQWIIALLYRVFGPHIYVTRGAVFVLGLFSVFGMYRLSYWQFQQKGISAICAWCFNWSPVFYYYTVNPMPDNMALCCGIWSVALFVRYLRSDRAGHLVLSALFLSLATLAKLPFIIYGSFPGAWFMMALFRKVKAGKLLTVATVFLVCLTPAVAWYRMVMPSWEIGAVRGVFDLSLNHPDLWRVLSGTVVSVFPELIINYASVLFFVAGLVLLVKDRVYAHPLFPAFLLWGLTIVGYFLFEMNIIDLVHDYYLYPFLPPVFLLAGYGARRIMQLATPARVLSGACLAALPVTAFLRADSRWDTHDPGFNPAYLKYKNELRQLTPPRALCVACDDESTYILLYYIDRKGWALPEHYLDERLLAYYVSKGAAYIFLDRHEDEDDGIKKHLGEKVFDKETLRVYKLK